MVFIASSIFIVAGFAYGAWCVVSATDTGVHMGTIGMAILSGALCYQGWTLMQGRVLARMAGVVSASAMAIGNLAVALLVALPWLSSGNGTNIPKALKPTLTLLLATGSAFAVAAAILMLDARARRRARMREV